MAAKAKTTRKPEIIDDEVVEKNLSQTFSYKNYEYLGRFMNDRARIQGRKRTGLSAKRQKALARAIKHARHLGLLPFRPNI